eukprot:gene5907-8150_t
MELALYLCVLNKVLEVVDIVDESEEFASSSSTLFHSQSNTMDKQLNPPNWPSKHVLVFSPNDFSSFEAMNQLDYSPNSLYMSNNQRLALTQGNLLLPTGHFSSERYAVLFKPGKYNLDFRVGYYVQVLGLGLQPSDVEFTSDRGVYCPATDPTGAGSLDTFWRSVENVKTGNGKTQNDIQTPYEPFGMLWAVSQAAPLRRVEVNGDLCLFDLAVASTPNLCCWASGGFIANSKVSNNILFGSQQQWMSRNIDWGEYTNGGAWSLVFANCKGQVDQSKTDAKVSTMTTSASATPAANPICYCEKPYITLGRDLNGYYTEKYYLQVPKVMWQPIIGSDLFDQANTSIERSIDFENVYVTNVDVDSSDSIQAALNTPGMHVVLTPGIYYLTSSLTISQNDQVLLGIGLATLVAPTNGEPSIVVKSNVTNVRIAGIMLEASASSNGSLSVNLLLWGDSSSSKRKLLPGQISGVLTDIFARVGGSDLDRSVGVQTMITIHSDYVIGDNLWLWRADHAVLEPNEAPPAGEKYHLVRWNEYRVDTALEVTGNNVFMYGLACEHTQKDLLKWSGEGGLTVFYQSELPYDANQESFGKNTFGTEDYCGYRVAENVSSHTGYAVGVYSFFRDSVVTISNGITTPTTANHNSNLGTIRFTNSFTRCLCREEQPTTYQSCIENVISNNGGKVGDLQESDFSDPQLVEEKVLKFQDLYEV